MPGAPRRLALSLALALAACGGASAEQGGAGRPPAPARAARRLEPSELLPADLDLVVRIDVARMRAGLGPTTVDDLAARALAAAPEDLLRAALSRADVVWLGVRLADLEAGDRVLVIEGSLRGLAADPALWKPVPGAPEGAVVLERSAAAPRAGTARLVTLGDRAIALVSPAEVDSVARVLRDGPDARRGDPAAEGILSLDLRAHRLPPRLERRFPSLGTLVAGLARVRAVASLSEEGLRLEAQILAESNTGAERARRFLEALRDNVAEPRYADVLAALSVDQADRTVMLRWLLPPRVVLALLSSVAPG